MNLRHTLGLALSILSVGITACGGGEGDAPGLAYDVETARTEVLAAEMAINEAVDGLDCATGVSLMGEADPIFVSSGNVVRTRAELAEICEQMVAPRSGAVFSIESRAAHVLADDAAFVVREGPYTVSYLDGTSEEFYLVMTSIWVREAERWEMVHLHESVRSPEIAELLAPGGG